MAPLIAALVSLAPKLIGPTIRAVEAIFGPKTGDTKMQAVIDALIPTLTKMAAAGKLPGIPDEATLRTVIESIFQQDKADIEADKQPDVKISGCFKIPAGSTVTIQIPPDTKADI